jgi:hypothetical protein
MEQKPQVQTQPLVKLRLHMHLVDKKSRSRMPRKALPSQLRQTGLTASPLQRKIPPTLNPAQIIMAQA